MLVLKIILSVVIFSVCVGVIALIIELLTKSNGHKPYGIYEKCIKRFLDAFLASGSLIVFSPILLILIILGAIQMRGNPFYIQKRPGRRNGTTGEEKIIKLIKFRSMTNEKDQYGNLLPDKDRLNRYGRIIRATSLDELSSLINIVKGDISIVGPRPLAVKYLPYYTKQEHHRHDVRPGLTGLAQVSGRNNLSWDEKFNYDLQYVNCITFRKDARIVLRTLKKVLVHEGIGQGEEMPVSLHVERANWILTRDGAVKNRRIEEKL